MIRVAVNGALGQMGQVTVAAVQACKAMELVGAWDKADSLADVLSVAQPDVMIDFTLPHCVFHHTQLAIEHGVRPVVGATGLTDEQVSALQAQCAAQALGGLIAPNFSISAILMMQMSQRAARFMPNVEIIEMHHPNKVDAPSGTAKATALMMAGDDASSVPIHSIRLPGMFAHQQVIFSAVGERLTIQQDCTSREAMMPGVLLAVEQVMLSSELVYGLEAFLHSEPRVSD